MDGYVLLPFDFGIKKVEEGFYQSPDKRLFYLSRKDDKWYFQFASDERPTFFTRHGPIIEAVKVDPHELLKRLEEERRFVESKLVSLTEKKD